MMVIMPLYWSLLISVGVGAGVETTGWKVLFAGVKFDLFIVISPLSGLQ